MDRRTLTVFELAPAADELWELAQDAACGYLDHAAGAVSLPDVASGAKLRPQVTAAYASGKATNVARVFDAFLRADATTAPARQARAELGARLVTYLPGQPGGYRHPEVPGPLLGQFTPGGAYLACLQARDFHAVELVLEPLCPTDGVQTDRRCANIVAAEGHELVNFSPHLLWHGGCVGDVLGGLPRAARAEVVALAGSLPLVDGKPAPDLYHRIIRLLREHMPGVFISLDVGGAPLQACLTGDPAGAPDVVCINVSEYSGVPSGLWERYAGVAVVHDKRGCFVLPGEALSDDRAPDVAVPSDIEVVHTICAGDAAHGGLLLGLMLYGTGAEGCRQAAVLSQACALAVVESPDSIRGLTAEKVERNLGRF